MAYGKCKPYEDLGTNAAILLISAMLEDVSGPLHPWLLVC
jgi:hypothetical protein